MRGDEGNVVAKCIHTGNEERKVCVFHELFVGFQCGLIVNTCLRIVVLRHKGEAGM